MENKQAIMNMKQGKNIPYKHETITTLITMADKLEKIKQIIDSRDGFYLYDNLPPFQQIREVLEDE